MGVFGVASAYDVTLKEFSLSWSLWLVVGGASASTMGGAVVAVTRSPAHHAPKPSTRTIGPSGNPAVEGAAATTTTTTTTTTTNPQQLPQHGHGLGRAGDHRGSGSDVTDIFNVVSFSSAAAGGSSAERAESHRGRNSSPYCWTDAGQPPPPYSPVATRLGGGRGACVWTGAGDHSSSTHLRELSLSPPPSYESVFSEPPPPYQEIPQPVPVVCVVSRRSSPDVQ